MSIHLSTLCTVGGLVATPPPEWMAAKIIMLYPGMSGYEFKTFPQCGAFIKVLFFSSDEDKILVLRWPYEGKSKAEFTVPMSLSKNSLKLLFSAWHLLLTGFPVWQIACRRGCWKPWHRQICKLLTQEPVQDSHLTLHTQHFEAIFVMTFVWDFVVILAQHMDSIWSSDAFNAVK